MQRRIYDNVLAIYHGHQLQAKYLIRNICCAQYAFTTKDKCSNVKLLGFVKIAAHYKCMKQGCGDYSAIKRNPPD